MPSPLLEYRGVGSKNAPLVWILPHCLSCLLNLPNSSLTKEWPIRWAAVAKQFMISTFTDGS